jgi:hypothetical protein
LQRGFSTFVEYSVKYEIAREKYLGADESGMCYLRLMASSRREVKPKVSSVMAAVALR